PAPLLELSLFALSQGAGGGLRLEPVHPGRRAPLHARRGPPRHLQGSGGPLLPAALLPLLRVPDATDRPRAGVCRRAHGVARRRSGDASGASHLRRLEGGLVRDPRRPSAARRLAARDLTRTQAPAAPRPRRAPAT